jgi:hypothetical protein
MTRHDLVAGFLLDSRRHDEVGLDVAEANKKTAELSSAARRRRMDSVR